MGCVRKSGPQALAMSIWPAISMPRSDCEGVHRGCVMYATAVVMAGVPALGVPYRPASSPVKRPDVGRAVSITEAGSRRRWVAFPVPGLAAVFGFERAFMDRQH